ncbi:MAG: carbamoyl-phosphate synthase domain-containing protein, partial [Flavobacteriaceae bacterium]
MKYHKRKRALLLLEDGTIFYGKSVSDKEHTAFGEICFNTGMTGYQEIFTDPSYFGQIMVLTNAHIGNYGAANDEVESDSIKIAGLICKNFSYTYSRPHADESLEEFLDRNETFAISDVDTRALVSHIREHGAQNAVISTRVDEVEALKLELNAVPSMAGLELSSKVSTKEPYFFGEPNAPYKVSV